MLRRPALVLCAAMMAGLAATGAPPDQPSPPPKFGFPGSTEPEIAVDQIHYYLIRGDRQRLGRFDPDGNFIPYAGIGSRTAGVILGDGPLKTLIANGNSRNSSVYEHRSGRLIRGMFAREPRGVFVPEIGSTVIDLKKDFDPKTTDRVIYNLPEFMFCTARQTAPDPPKAGQPKGWKLVPFREAFPNTPEMQNPWFARVIGDMMELGHLSDEGEFIPDYGLPVFPYVRVKEIPGYYDGNGRSMYYTLPVVEGNNIKVGEDAEGVYEYRSGRLIQGTLQKTGNFVPDLGSKVLDFKDYDPATPRKRRIYNLPGVLRPIK